MVIYNQTEKTLKNLPHRTGGKGAEKGEKMPEKPCDGYIVTHLQRGGEEVQEDEVKHATAEKLQKIYPDEERPCNCGSGVHWAFCPCNSPYCG